MKLETPNWPFVSGILLAAGESKRMGGRKLFLPFAATTVAGAALQALLASQVREVVVVLGYQAQKVRRHLAENASLSGCEQWSVVSGESSNLKLETRNLRFVVNSRYKEGMFSSLLCGLQAASAYADAFLISLADMPAVTSDVVDALLSAFRSVDQAPSPLDHPPPSWAGPNVCATTPRGKGIVVPTYQGRRGHPLLIHSRYRREIRLLDPQIGLRALFSLHPDQVVEVPVDCPGVLRDIDHWEDYTPG